MRRDVLLRLAAPTIAFSLLAQAGCRQDKPAGSPRATDETVKSVPSLTSLEQPVQAQLHKVNLELDPEIVLRIDAMRGALVPTRRETPATFDDKTSFTVKIDYGQIGISSDDLAKLMNAYVFAYPGAPLSHIRIKIEAGRMKQSGVLKKRVSIPFELEGPLSVADGKIRLHVAGIKSAHLPAKGLMDLLGVKIAGLINLNGARGVRVEGDDLLLDPETLTPPPHVRGKITAVRTAGQELVLVFAGADSRASGVHALAPPRPDAPGYMYFRGGTLRFGKLTMVDADLQIVDANSRDWFDFNLDQYNRQLVAGYTKNTPDHGLIVFMPDFHSLEEGAPTGPHQRKAQGARD